MNLKDMYKKLTGYISNERLKHSIGVMETAMKLAGLYKVDKEKARIAGLLHDVARDLTLEEITSICSEKVKEINQYIKNSVSILHACAGRVIAERDFGISDPEVLSAIEKHTTGSKDMNMLDKIVFVSDYIEPTRCFKGVKKARDLAYKNLDLAMLYIYRSILIYLLRKTRYICKDTLEGYNSILVNLKSRDNVLFK